RTVPVELPGPPDTRRRARLRPGAAYGAQPGRPEAGEPVRPNRTRGLLQHLHGPLRTRLRVLRAARAHRGQPEPGDRRGARLARRGIPVRAVPSGIHPHPARPPDPPRSARLAAPGRGAGRRSGLADRVRAAVTASGARIRAPDTGTARASVGYIAYVARAVAARGRQIVR